MSIWNLMNVLVRQRFLLIMILSAAILALNSSLAQSLQSESSTIVAHSLSSPPRDPNLPPGTVRPKMILPCTPPVWPSDQLQTETQYVVTVQLLIGADGLVKDQKIRKSSGNRAFDKAVTLAFERCNFTPGKIEGEIATQWTQMQYVLNTK